MKKEYYSKNGLWLILTVFAIYVVTIYYIVDSGYDTFNEYLPFIIILVLNTAMLVLFRRELFSKKPMLVLETDQLTYRGMLKTYNVKYSEILKIQKTYTGTKNKNHVNRIGMKLKDIKKPVYIILQSINYDAEKLFEEIMDTIYKREANK